MKAEEIQTDGAQNGSLPVVFTFEKQAIRTIAKDDETWFIAADVCKVLGIKNTTQAVAPLDEDEKGLCLTETLGGSQDLNVVNEFGLYRLILRSDKANAKAFQRWVIHDVLPSIRKTGRYEAGDQDQPQIEEIEVDHARRRFQQIYISGFVSPDLLLRILFGASIPVTGDNKFRFLAAPACEALGLPNLTAALASIPEPEQGFVLLHTPQGPRKMHAITEAGLYFLAFTPRAPADDAVNRELNFRLLCNAVHFTESAWYEFR